MTTTHRLTCKACGSDCAQGKATPIGNYGAICCACLVILKAGGDPTDGRDRLHKRIVPSPRFAPRDAEFVYEDPLAPIRQWRATERAIMAARPAEATCACACCGDVYAVKGLKALDSDWVYTQVIDRELASIERDDLLCKFCRASLMSEVGVERPDVYNINDVLYGHDVDF